MKQLIAILVLISLPTQLVHAQAKDMLWKRGNNKVISGEITNVSPEVISIKSGGKSLDLSVSEIDRLIFRDDPSGLASVRSAFKNGQLEQAQTQLASIEPGGRNFVQQEIEFYQAMVQAKLALRGTADVKDAARDIGAFLKQNGDSFRYFEACETMGDLAMSLGRFDSATRYYEKLASSKSTTIAARGALLLGDASLLKGDVTRAAEMFARCTKATDARLQAMGKLGAAICLCQNPQGAEQAIQMIEDVIAENDSSDVELFARAYNALGKAFMATGKTESALDAYLHTDLLFYRDSEKHAEALFHLSKLWSEVNNPTEASKARQTLKTRYAASVWAKR